jgi:hypothetical protein
MPVQEVRARLVKHYVKPSLAARLYHLEVGDYIVLPVPADSSLQVTFNYVHTLAATNEALAGRRFSCRKWLLVREDELPREAVLVTRTE